MSFPWTSLLPLPLSGFIQILVLACAYYYVFLFFRGTRGINVLAGLEGSLWDLRGKMELRPVHELLGPRQATARALVSAARARRPAVPDAAYAVSAVWAWWCLAPVGSDIHRTGLGPQLRRGVEQCCVTP